MDEDGKVPLNPVAGLDFDKGLRLYEGRTSVYLEVLRAFHRHGARQISAMRNALSARDLRRYAIEAHALKSAARGSGALSLGTLAAEQELAGKQGDWEAVRLGADVLLDSYAALLNALEEAGLTKPVNRPTVATPVKADRLRECLETAAGYAREYDLGAVEEIVRDLLCYPLDQALRQELQSVLDMCGCFEYDGTEAALKTLLSA